MTPGRWCMPTVGKAQGSGILSTGRSPHAIPGVTLPVAVILTAHRFRSPRHPARQTAWGLVNIQLPLASYEANVASEARDAFVLLLPLFSRGRPGWGLIYLGSGLAGSALSAAAICQPAVGGGGPRGKRPPPWQSRAQVYADCRESPSLRAVLHRPGATRHPWRDAPSPGHPDRSPPTITLPSARQTAPSFGEPAKANKM